VDPSNINKDVASTKTYKKFIYIYIIYIYRSNRSEGTYGRNTNGYMTSHLHLHKTS
jgi:hypothetical protein